MKDSAKLGLGGLVAIVFGSVIGGSIFNIAQNMARNAALGPVIAAWFITAIGVFFLVLTFKKLADACPDLRAGIYQYALAGFGRYAGFNMAWGYWLCVVMGNVTYAVMLNDSVGAFFPVLMNHSWPTVLFASVLIWLMYLLVSQGVKSAAFVNNILALVKFTCLALIVVVLVICVRIDLFTADFWGRATLPESDTVAGQFSSCMLVTIWSFVGIEGAVMMSARAKRHKDVGRATVAGFLLALVLYLLVTVLCFGVMTRPEMAELPNPSLAYVLDSCAGHWAKWFVIASVIVSLTGGFVAWTLVSAQVPYEAAQVGILPRQFMRLNSKGMPSYGMLVASIAMTVCVVLVVTAENVYIAALNLTAMMVLPPYLFCALYLWKLCGKTGRRRQLKGSVAGNRIVAAMAALFCVYIMWAGGFGLMMVTSLFYLAGIGFFALSRRQQGYPGTAGKIFTRGELMVFAMIVVLSVASVALLLTGHIRLDG